MRKTRIVGEKRLLTRVLERVKVWGGLHLTPVEPGETGARRPTLTAEQEKGRESLATLVSTSSEALLLLGWDGKATELEPDPLSRAEETSRLREQAAALSAEEQALQDELSVLSDYAPLAESGDFVPAPGCGVVALALPKQDTRYLNALMERTKETEPLHVEVSLISGGRVAIFVVVEESRLEKVRELFRSEGFNELLLPERFRAMPLTEALPAMKSTLNALPGKIDALKQEIEALGREGGPLLARVKAAALDRLETFTVLEEYPAVTRYSFLLCGYAPANRTGELSGLLGGLDGEVELLHEKPLRKEYPDVPVVLENGPFSRPFTVLTELFPKPVYGTLDPTWLLWFFFPPYFGFMLGDAGYGLLGLLGFGFMWAAGRRNRMVKSFGQLFTWCMAWTVLFGVLYGEFFGTLGEHLGMKPILLHRLHDIKPLLLISIAFGVVQVLLGIVLGIYNQLLLGHIKHALGEFFRLVGVLGLLLTVGGLATAHSGVMYGGIVMLVVGVPAFTYFEGFIAPIELVSAVGNMLSFARLMAIGLVSAIIPMIANDFMGMIGVFSFAVVVTAIFHGLAMLLGIVDPTIQGLRLQFVEFFSRFYQAGGTDYKPFLEGGNNYAS